MSQYFGGSEDRKETPGMQPPAAAKPGLFVAASPDKAFPNPHPAGGQLNLFGDTAASPPDSLPHLRRPVHHVRRRLDL